MNRALSRAVVLAAVQAALVAVVGLSAVIDRARLPRAVVELVPASASVMEGRYLVGRIEMPVSGDWKAPVAPGPGEFAQHGRVDVAVRNGRLIAIPGSRYPVEQVTATAGPEVPRVRLMLPVRLYLGPGASKPLAQPQRRWIEVSLPGTGSPRAIRLAAPPQ